LRDQITIAKLPLAKDIDDFVFDDTPLNEALVREREGGALPACVLAARSIAPARSSPLGHA
jgi:hypothetical protein